jgi:hypothetical protein
MEYYRTYKYDGSEYSWHECPECYDIKNLSWQNEALLIECDRLNARVEDLEAAVESLTRTVRSLVLREKLEKEQKTTQDREEERKAEA